MSERQREREGKESQRQRQGMRREAGHQMVCFDERFRKLEQPLLLHPSLGMRCSASCGIKCERGITRPTDNLTDLLPSRSREEAKSARVEPHLCAR